MTTRRLVVIPSDPIANYEAGGIDYLARYFNPCGMFQEVYALSPLERGVRYAHGMTILGVHEHEFADRLREIAPDVVRAYGGFWPADLACRSRIPGVPVIVSVHDTDKALLNRGVRYADLVVCMSQAVADVVATTAGVPRDRFRILPNRIDTQIFHPTCEGAVVEQIRRRFPRGRHILHVGRKTAQKNLDTLIRSLATLPADYSCIFVGQGDRAAYVALAEQVGVAARCHWIEAIRNSELPAWYSWCDCMCVPSRWEGFGIVFIEAAACGAPIIASDIAPMNEYLTHDRSACLVKKYEDHTVLAAAIRRVCEDDAYRTTISTGAQQTAARFDRAIVDTQEAAIYEDTLRRGAYPFPLTAHLERELWKLTTHRLASRLAEFPRRVKQRLAPALADRQR